MLFLQNVCGREQQQQQLVLLWARRTVASAVVAAVEGQINSLSALMCSIDF
jgi:hypothetical protein